MAAESQSQPASAEAARRARQRAAARAYGEFLQRRTPRQAEADEALIESSNAVALRDAQWSNDSATP
jgi:hypothetical protein